VPEALVDRETLFKKAETGGCFGSSPPTISIWSLGLGTVSSNPLRQKGAVVLEKSDFLVKVHSGVSRNDSQV